MNSFQGRIRGISGSISRGNNVWPVRMPLGMSRISRSPLMGRKPVRKPKKKNLYTLFFQYLSHHYLASCLLSPFLFVSSSLPHNLIPLTHSYSINLKIWDMHQSIFTLCSFFLFVEGTLLCRYIFSLYNYFAAHNLFHNCTFPRTVPWLCQFTLETHYLFNWLLFCTLHNHVNLLHQFEMMSSAWQKKDFMNFIALNFRIYFFFLKDVQSKY